MDKGKTTSFDTLQACYRIADERLDYKGYDSVGKEGV